MRKAVLSKMAVTAVTLSIFARLAAANCADFPGNHRSFVAQPNDLFFTAGAPSTKTIPQSYVNFTSADGAFGDCGVIAVSTIPGVNVKQVYGVTGNIGPSEQVAVSSGHQPGTTPWYNAQKDVPVIYDGTAPAGSAGSVNFYVQDDFGNLGVMLAQVNVYIVAAGAIPRTWFNVTSTAATVSGSSLILNNVLLNGKPSARLLAIHFGNGRSWNHPIAVTYDSTLGRWKIRNEDNVPMPVGLAFTVRIDRAATKLVTPAKGASNSLMIDDPRSNGNPYAVIVAAPWSGSGTIRMAHPFAVAYTPPHWYVMFTDGTKMPNSCKTKNCKNSGGFFVHILGAGQYIDDRRSSDPSGFNQTSMSNGAGTDLFANASRLSGNAKVLNRFCWTANGPEPIIATLNATALPPPAPINYNSVDGRYFGVSVAGNVSTVFHEDNSLMTENVALNVWGPSNFQCTGNVIGQ